MPSIKVKRRLPDGSFAARMESLFPELDEEQRDFMEELENTTLLLDYIQLKSIKDSISITKLSQQVEKLSNSITP